MRIAMVLFIGIHLTCARKHSLQYFYTAVSGDVDFPKFTIVSLMDGQQFFYYDSKIKAAVPKTEWIRQNEGADYWNGETEKHTTEQTVFNNNIQALKGRFNHSTGGSGVHTFQWMYGCELEDDGTRQGHWEIGYDGEDFISFDKSTSTYIAANPQATITKNKWDFQNLNRNKRKMYLDIECIKWLINYVGYAKDSQEERVSPRVSLLQKYYSSPVMCHATGFYPSGIKISWQKNGQEHDEGVELSELLPNADGTFQKTSSLNVKPEEWNNNKFSCVVEHQGETKAADEKIN
ncbi:class I histocompatibility antigen, F10 alpha chain-like [Danio aesculapii]|uniref:class I histocompatibility antigen, F10 alpha chain-like n=1 Tax=Danio aesculapii TaxID=1142201 RepID=UPI0024BFB56F|nr:class I histocompatibility antigen, F10 alpha chain-like [Danio aesculapii]